MTTTLETSPLDPASLPHGAADQFERLRGIAVTRTGLLDTGSEERFDRITRSAAQRFDVPFAFLTLLVDDRQYVKSMVGRVDREVPREAAFCNVTIRSEDGLVVPDMLDHPSFRTNPFVAGPPHVRFYAGMPLRGPGGWFVGSLCVLNTRPQEFTDADRRALRRLAERAELELNRHPAGQVPQ